MSEAMFIELCERLAENMFLQWFLIVFGVCFLEDVARCAVGLLVAAAQLRWWFAFSGMMVGSLIGDLALYLVGRYARDFCVGRGWVNAERLEKTKERFSQHAIKTIVGARFFIGARTVFYVAAGATHYRFVRFFTVLFSITVLQNLIYLYGTDFIGDQVLGYFGDPRMLWIAGGLLLVLITLAHYMILKRKKRMDQAL